MPNILLIESSSISCSVAVYSDGKVKHKNSFSEGMKHAEKLPVFVESAIEYAKSNGITFDAVAVSGGPGSYTGLRIGVSHAKGICYGMNIPLIAIDTLKIIAIKALRNSNLKSDYTCPMVDARRMEVYCCMFDNDFNSVMDHQAKVIEDGSFSNLLSDKKILFCGNGAEKCMETINSNNAMYYTENILDAEDMAGLALKMYEAKDFADLAYYEPFYLKEFQSTIPKAKL